MNFSEITSFCPPIEGVSVVPMENGVLDLEGLTEDQKKAVLEAFEATYGIPAEVKAEAKAKVKTKAGPVIDEIQGES